MKLPDFLSVRLFVTDPVGDNTSASIEVFMTPRVDPNILSQRFLSGLPSEMKSRLKPGAVYEITFTPESGITVVSSAQDGGEKHEVDETMNTWLGTQFESQMNQLWAELQVASRAIPDEAILCEQMAEVIEVQLHRAVIERREHEIMPGMFHILVVQAIDLLEREFQEMDSSRHINPFQLPTMPDIWAEVDMAMHLEQAYAAIEHPLAIAVQLEIPSDNPFLHMAAWETEDLARNMLEELWPTTLDRVAKRMRAAASRMERIFALTIADFNDPIDPTDPTDHEPSIDRLVNVEALLNGGEL